MIDAGTKEVLRLKYEFHEPSDNVFFVKKKKFKEPKQNQTCQKKKKKVKEERIKKCEMFCEFCLL